VATKAPGKEVIARLIHACGARGEAGPFVTEVRPGTGPDTRRNRRRSASTDVQHEGNILASLGGTLFSTTSRLSRDAQIGLLRVMKEWGSPVGVLGTHPSNRGRHDPEHGTSGPRRPILEELYYRLNVIPMEIPSLRDRPEDIPILVDHFRRAANARRGRARCPPLARGLGPAWVPVLGRGNVRQLGRHSGPSGIGGQGPNGDRQRICPASLRTDVSELGPSLVDLPPNGKSTCGLLLAPT